MDISNLCCQGYSVPQTERAIFTEPFPLPFFVPQCKGELKAICEEWELHECSAG